MNGATRIGGIFFKADGPGGTGNRARISGFEAWQTGADGRVAESLEIYAAIAYQRQADQGSGGE